MVGHEEVYVYDETAGKRFGQGRTISYAVPARSGGSAWTSLIGRTPVSCAND